jgi:hypothetical protein
MPFRAVKILEKIIFPVIGTGKKAETLWVEPSVRFRLVGTGLGFLIKID